jgi:hypothetical protein
MNLLALKIMTAEITASTILMDRNNATILAVLWCSLDVLVDDHIHIIRTIEDYIERP